MTTQNPNLGTVVTDQRARKIIYGVYVIALVVVGAIQAGYGVLDGVQPDWLTVAVSVMGYLGIPVGGLAIANTPSKSASSSH